MFYTFYTRTRAPTTGVISVTAPLSVTAADSGKAYSLDSATARIDLPARGDISTGWTITMQCTLAGRYCIVQPSDVGEGFFSYESNDYDGVSLESLDAVATIAYNGSQFVATAISGSVLGYLN